VLVDNYWKVDTAQGNIRFWIEEAERSLVKLNALLHMRVPQQVASTQERDVLLLALGDYKEQLRPYTQQLVAC
jgi:hypothetical protein